MKMSDFWPKGKAITLVFCRKMTKIENELAEKKSIILCLNLRKSRMSLKVVYDTLYI